MFVTKMADVCESELTKKKGFRWSSEMIGNLVTCLMAYKARMEYQALHFDGDRPAQYKELRKELAKLYEIEDVSLFGPVSLSSPTSLQDISEDERIPTTLSRTRPSFLQSALAGPGMKFPYEIDLEFLPASWACPAHMNMP